MMIFKAIFSNSCFFLLLQFALLALFLFALGEEWHGRRKAATGARVAGNHVTATVERGRESMELLQKYTGLVIAAVITIINKSVFDDNESGWRHYSAAINFFDLFAILFVCYVSPWGRQKLFALNERLRKEPR